MVVVVVVVVVVGVVVELEGIVGLADYVRNH